MENIYSEKIMDHFRNPRNLGEIAEADGVVFDGAFQGFDIGAVHGGYFLVLALVPLRQVVDEDAEYRVERELFQRLRHSKQRARGIDGRKSKHGRVLNPAQLSANPATDTR